MVKIATPISQFFDDQDAAELILENSDCLEGRQEKDDIFIDRQEIFHFSFQLIHEFNDDIVAYLKKIRERNNFLRLISFHVVTCSAEYRSDDYMAYPIGKCISRDELLKNAGRNIGAIRSIFGPHIEIGIENNNFFPSGAYEHVTDADFLAKIVRDNGMRFVLDISHARITAQNRRTDFIQYLEALPLECATQLHISGFKRRTDGLAYDAHEFPSQEDWSLVQAILTKYKTIQYVTLEYYKKLDSLIEGLQKIREILHVIS